MTSRRWDNVPKPRVERPPLLVPNSKPARRKQTPQNIKNCDEKAGQVRSEPQHPARAARATGIGIGSARCSTCEARGVTLWRVAGSLLCGSCRPANRTAYAPQSGPRQKPDPRNAARKDRTATIAGTEKDIEWAARQGVTDRKAGTECRKYKTFLVTYELHKSDASLCLWDAYRKQTKAERVNKPVPDLKRRSNWTRGLSISDTATPRRKYVRKYDRESPRESELSPGIAALLMKLNQQNTLVDMWR